ncbi:hypothetical protein [Sutcliffiella horikoshii]|uniref:hypothetical protein n=1 Tax=Sutcliffiella horikoshii TaxID=79883 RepID=UPI003850CADF
MKKEKNSCGGCFCDFYDDLRGISPAFQSISIAENPVPIVVGPVPGTGNTLFVNSITLTRIDRDTCCAHFIVVTSFNPPVVVPGFPAGIYTAETVIACDKIVAFSPAGNE